MVGNYVRKICSILLCLALGMVILTPLCGSENIPIERMLAPPGWTEDIRLTNNASAADWYPTIDANGDAVHLVWRNQRIGQNEIYYINSTDGGNTWSQGTRLSPGDPIDCTEPRIKVNGNQINVVWAENSGFGAEIMYCNSTDGGISWNERKMISEEDGFDSRAPHLANNNTNIHVIWGDDRYGLAQSEVFYRRSTDGGITWDDGDGNNDMDRRLSYNLSEIFAPRLAINNSYIHVTWEDESDGSADVYYVRSVDNGVTWDDGLGNFDEARKLSSNSTSHGAGGNIAADDEVVHVIWTDGIWPGPINYLYYINSIDNGETWSTPRLLSGPSPQMNMPDILAVNGTVHITWGDARDNGVNLQNYYMYSLDRGATWSSEIILTDNQTGDRLWPRLAVDGTTVHITWWDERDGQPEIYYKRYEAPDTAPPEINHVPVLTTNIGQEINITAKVIDNKGVSSVRLNYTGIDGMNHNISMNNWGNNWSYNIPGQYNIGLVNYFIWCNDTSGNMNLSDVYSIQIIDFNSPLINHVLNSFSPLNVPITVNANIIDDVEVNEVRLYYENVGGTTYSIIVMNLNSGNNKNGNWTATIPPQTKVGTVHYFLSANDTSGNNVTSPVMGDYSIQITGPPGIVITEPKGGERWTGGNNQQIEFTATDTEDSPGDLIVFLNYTSGAGNGFIAQVTGASSLYNWPLPTINATDVKINATVIDSDSNKAYADSPLFIIDSTPPRILSTNPANNTTSISIFQPIMFQFSEPMNISSVIVNQTGGTNSEGWQWFWNTGKDTLTGIHNAWPRGEVVEITVHAGYTDASEPGNANNTAYVFTFTTEINPIPEIVHANISGPQELGDAIRINATITDDGAVMNAVLWWRDVDGVWRESRMQKAGDNWEFILPGQMAEGKGRYQINATNDLGQKNSTAIYEFDVVDSTPPVITHAPIANAVIDEPINITCLVTDLGRVDAVYLHYRNESEANFTELAMNPGYWYELTACSIPITIEYYIMAVDQYGNEVSTEIYALEIIDPTVPDNTPPEVLFVEPTGVDVPVTTSISIVFTEAVDRISVENAITVSPTVSSVSYTWLNDQTLIVSFNALQYNTTYTVTIGTGATDLAGNALASADSWEFTTAMEPEIVPQPTPNNWGWIGIIIFLIVIIALMLLYLFNKEKKEPDHK